MASLKKNIFYSGILTTANYLFPLITYPYVSRVLGVDNIGVCNFVDSIINYFVIISSLGIGIVGIREIAVSKNDRLRLEESFSKLFTINTITTTIALVLLVAGIFLIPQLRVNYELMFIGVLKLLFNYLLIEWFYKGLEQFKYITNRTILVKILYVICVFLFVHDENDVLIYYFLLSFTLVINAFINIIHARSYIRFRLSFTGLGHYFKSLSILGLYNILTSMYTTFNVAYLGFVADNIQVGYYTTSTKIHSIILMLFTAITGVLMPRMTSLLSQGNNKEFKRLIKKSIIILCMISAPAVIIIELFAPFFIHIIAGEGYEGAIVPLRIIAPLILIIGIEQILITQSLMPMGQDKAVLFNSALGATVGLVLNILLVPNLQSIGSAIVWVSCELVVMFSASYFFLKAWKKMK